MAMKDPFRVLIEEVALEFYELSELCKRFEKRHNQKMAEENTKWKCFVDSVTGRDTHLRGDEVNPFVDKSAKVIKKLDKLEAYFIDMKCRYLWAQNRIAEQNICLIRNAANQRRAKFSEPLKDIQNISTIRESKRKSSTKLREVTVEPPGTGFVDAKESHNGKTFPSKRVTSKWHVNTKYVDNILGMGLFSNDHEEESEVRKDSRIIREATESPKRLITKFQKSPELIEIEEIFENDENRSLESLLQESTYSNQEQFVNDFNREARFEQAIESEYKMQILALKKEIEERDEDIDVLISQLKIKSLEVEYLMKVIPRELIELP